MSLTDPFADNHKLEASTNLSNTKNDISQPSPVKNVAELALINFNKTLTIPTPKKRPASVELNPEHLCQICLNRANEEIQQPLSKEIIEHSTELGLSSAIHPQIFVVYKKKKTKTVEAEEDVSEGFVKRFNEHIGNRKNQEKARRLIAKMRELGGLDESDKKDFKIDIPAARLGFCILARLNDPILKMQALDCLIELLNRDEFHKSTSVGLVSLAIKLMHSLDEELMQSEIVDVQIKISQAYSIVAELIQRHYANKHINAITKNLKLQLIETTKALESLNRLRDSKLSFHVHCALEGVRRLIDNRKELFDLLERFYHLLWLAGNVYAENGKEAVKHLQLMFKNIDPHLPNSWYNGVLMIKALGRDAQSDLHKLDLLMQLIGEKFKKLDWKFCYAAVQILGELTIIGKTPEIRKRAFDGIKVYGSDYPGLKYFVSCNCLKKVPDLSPMIHFEKPLMKDLNLRTRHVAIENLIKIYQESPDEYIRNKAAKLLEHRRELETNKPTIDLLEEHAPKKHSLLDLEDPVVEEYSANNLVESESHDDPLLPIVGTKVVEKAPEQISIIDDDMSISSESTDSDISDIEMDN